ncbi:hypothetical protein RHMOL_Rhmol02G0172300 [Rhododendron molle]|uniref:Uncharacterized protein n=1 Tax=Rhododendron molle TaxID=49168 RepID=A0ACC0PQV3_RHOML|nr:hypothetical protein RHMOL_Rhmol02G0172300 [Rhododendron molle]
MHNRLRDLSVHKKVANQYHCIPLSSSSTNSQIPDFCVELGVEVALWESSLGIGVVGIVALPLPLPLAHDAVEGFDG